MVKLQKGSGNNNNNNFVMVNSPNLNSNIISYNLSWATQKNEAAGTEKEYVKWCKKSAKSRKSNFDQFLLSDSNIDSNEADDSGFKSWCTKNGLDGIIEYVNKNNSNPIQFIGFQECTDLVFAPPQKSLCLTYLNDGITDVTLEQINSEKVKNDSFVSLLFNTALYTKIDDLHGDMDSKSGRPYLISSFKNKLDTKKTIVCVLHATHESKVRDDYINYTIIPNMYELGDNDINNRYILLGDFNGLPKFYNKPESIDMFTQYKESNLPNSCCWQESHGFTLSKGFYNGISDIIYDSSNLGSINPVSILPGFGDPFNSKTRKHKQNIPSNVKTGSDHLPVCLKYGIVDMVSSQNMLPGQKRKKSKKPKSKKLKSKKPKKQKTRKYRK